MALSLELNKYSFCSFLQLFVQRLLSFGFIFSAEFAEVDILEDVDAATEEYSSFNLEWMINVVYLIQTPFQPAQPRGQYR